MDFLTLNFGQLLHLLDNELKNIIRNFEKQKKQIISAQYGILLTKYIYIYIAKFVSEITFEKHLRSVSRAASQGLLP